MNLYLLRHGIAVDRAESDPAKDSERPLTAKGKQRLWESTKAMEALELNFKVILSSPYLRAMQTAEIVAEAFTLRKKLIFTDKLAPGGNPKALIEQINALKPAAKNILLVGHEPYLSQFIATLTGGGPKLQLELRKGGLAKLETEALRYGRCATLAWLLTPKQMLAMG